MLGLLSKVEQHQSNKSHNINHSSSNKNGHNTHYSTAPPTASTSHAHAHAHRSHDSKRAHIGSGSSVGIRGRSGINNKAAVAAFGVADERVNFRRLLSRVEAILQGAPIKDNVRAMIPKYMEALREQLEYLRSAGAPVGAVLADLAEKEKLVQSTITSSLTRTISNMNGTAAAASDASSTAYRATSREQLRSSMATRRARLRDDGLARTELLQIRSHTANDDNDDLIPDDDDVTDDDNDTQPGREPGGLPSYDDTQPGASLLSSKISTPLPSSSSSSTTTSSPTGEGKEQAAVMSTIGLRQRSTAATVSTSSSSSKQKFSSKGSDDDRAQLLTKSRTTGDKHGHAKEELLEDERRTHDELTSSLADMTGRLKFTAIKMGDRMKKDQSIIEQAGEVIDKETPRLQKQIQRLDELIGSATSSWWFLMSTLVLVFFAFWFMYIFMKLVPKPRY